MTEVSLTPADGAVTARITELAREFWLEAGFAHEERQRKALHRLAESPDLGKVYVIDFNGSEVGYAVLCWGFSIEFGGRDAFLDEFYVVADHRKRGIGAQALELLAEAAKTEGCAALHLEVMPGNERVLDLYGRAGFKTRRSQLMSRMLG